MAPGFNLGQANIRDRPSLLIAVFDQYIGSYFKRKAGRDDANKKHYR